MRYICIYVCHAEDREALGFDTIHVLDKHTVTLIFFFYFRANCIFMRGTGDSAYIYTSGDLYQDL